MSKLPPQITQIINEDRLMAKSVLPIENEGVTYRISSSLRVDERGKIIGLDWKCGAFSSDNLLLWQTTYFSQDFQLNLETDVQELHPVDLYFKDDVIVIEHEGGSAPFYVKKNGDTVEVDLPL